MLINEFLVNFQNTKLMYRNLICSSDKLSENIRKISSTIAQERIKLSRNKSNQGGKRPVHGKLWNTDEKKWRQHRWQDICNYVIERINTVNMAILPKALCRFSATSTKILLQFFTELGQIILKFVLKHIIPQTTSNLEKKTTATATTTKKLEVSYALILNYIAKLQ